MHSRFWESFHFSVKDAERGGYMKIREIKKAAAEKFVAYCGQVMAAVLIILSITVVFTVAEGCVYNFFKTMGLINNSEFAFGNIYLIITAGLFFILGYVFLVPVYVGTVWWFLHFVRGEKNSIKSLFICYSKFSIFAKTIALKAVVLFYKVLLLIPIIGVIYLTSKMMKISFSTDVTSSEIIMLTICGILFAVCIIMLYIYYIFSFALVDYIFVFNPDLKISRIIGLSFTIMKKNKAKFFKFSLSFLAWLPACLLVFPLLYVVPYFATAFTMLASDVLLKNIAVHEETVTGRTTQYEMIRDS